MSAHSGHLVDGNHIRAEDADDRCAHDVPDDPKGAWKRPWEKCGRVCRIKSTVATWATMVFACCVELRIAFSAKHDAPHRGCVADCGDGGSVTGGSGMLPL